MAGIEVNGKRYPLEKFKEIHRRVDKATQSMCLSGCGGSSCENCNSVCAPVDIYYYNGLLACDGCGRDWDLDELEDPNFEVYNLKNIIDTKFEERKRRLHAL